RWPDGRGASPLGEDAPDGRGSARRGDGPRGTPAARESPVGSGGGGERHGPRPAAAGKVLYFSPLIGGVPRVQDLRDGLLGLERPRGDRVDRCTRECHAKSRPSLMARLYYAMCRGLKAEDDYPHPPEAQPPDR